MKPDKDERPIIAIIRQKFLEDYLHAEREIQKRLADQELARWKRRQWFFTILLLVIAISVSIIDRFLE